MSVTGSIMKGPLLSKNGLQPSAASVIVTNIFRGTVTIAPSSIAATTMAEQTFTLTGAAVGDSLVLNPPAATVQAGISVSQCFVSATNTVAIRFYNSTAGPLTIPSAAWTYLIVRS